MNVFDQMLDGWTDDQWVQHTSEVQTQCVGGRLILMLEGRTLRSGDENRPEWQHLQAVIRDQPRTWATISVQQWNDTPWRTFAEVREVVELASLRWDLAHRPEPAFT